MSTYSLTELPEHYAVCLLPPMSPFPLWAQQGAFWSVTRTPDELSVVCDERQVPPIGTDGLREAAGDWLLLRVDGPFDFGVTGVLAALTRVLAEAAVPCLAIATHQTDYLLFQTTHQAAARAALVAAGHTYRTAG